MLFHRLTLICCIALGLAFALAGKAEAAKPEVLHVFTGGADGGSPADNLLRDAGGNLYGTTVIGGAYGHGVVFKLAPDGTETVLHSFNGKDGDWATTLRQDQKTGDFYGVAFYGGSDGCGGSGCGVIYKLSPDGTETILHSFSGSDGYIPYDLRRDDVDTIYGVTAYGGTNNCGVLYKLTADGTYSILHTFVGSDGCHPRVRLIGDGVGNLYGTTQAGGTHQCGSSKCGVLFELAQDGTYSVLHDFEGGAGGEAPAGVVRDKAGNIFGTTYYGGSDSECANKTTCGLVFKLNSHGKFTVLHAFTGLRDGGHPHALANTSAGEIYGRTYVGGGCCGKGLGTVFSMASDGTVKTIFRFHRTGVGFGGGGLLIGDSEIYGTAEDNGGNGYQAGTVFAVKK